MNLLDEAWIPIRRSNGAQEWISPYQITEPTIVALDARRADFNGALIQFLIGLIQTTTPIDSEVEWKQWNEQPPSAEELKKWFEPVRDAFVFDGDGARFMQDFSLRTSEVELNALTGISSLLIEAPGENALKNNTDHFVKRTEVGYCYCCAASALFTLQTNAPSGGGGGDGYFTSIRGGGPLTTLVASNNGLWNFVWLNVRPQGIFLTSSGDAEKKDLYHIFPWLKEMYGVRPKISPIQVNPLQSFWGMPRRIRFDFDRTMTGACGICNTFSEKLIWRYFTKTGGYDYVNWQHPLSPHTEKKPGEYIPIHLQNDGVGYKYWLEYVLGRKTSKVNLVPASIVTYVFSSRRLSKVSHARLIIFGYDMAKAKARCWYESALPIYGISQKNADEIAEVQREVTRWLESANTVLFFLRRAVFAAWLSGTEESFDEKDGIFVEGKKTKNKLNEIDASFWAQTENGFYQLLGSLIEQAKNEDEDIVFTSLREQWRNLLIKTAIRLFDADLVGAAPIAQQNPRRTAEAYKRLCASLQGDKLKDTLKLPTAKTDKKTKKTKQDAA